MLNRHWGKGDKTRMGDAVTLLLRRWAETWSLHYGAPAGKQMLAMTLKSSLFLAYP